MASKKKSNRGNPSSQPADTNPLIPGIEAADLRRGAEPLLRQIARQLGGNSDDHPENSAKQQAEELMDQVFSESNRQKQKRLVDQALEIFPDCCEAWIWKAGEAPTAQRANELYHTAVNAGRRALGKQFPKLTGHFWLAIETRPFMRAMQGLADSAAAMGNRQRAAELYQKMLELNPNDNQGVRWNLMQMLLELDQNEAARELLKRYDDEALSLWPAAKLLLGYRERKPDQELLPVLADLHERNPHLAEMILEGEVPQEGPATFGFGQESEAEMVAMMLMPALRSTPGALPWFRKLMARSGLPGQARQQETKKSRPDFEREDLEDLLDEALELPQKSGAVWLVHTEKVVIADRPVWAIQACTEKCEPVQIEILEIKPNAHAFSVFIAGAIVNDRNRCRPAVIRLSSKSFLKTLAKTIGGLDIAVELGDKSAFPSLKKFVKATLHNHRDADLDQPVETLPMTDMVWQLGTMTLSRPVEEAGELIRPISTLIVESELGLVLGNELFLHAPTAADCLVAIRKAMFSPSLPKPARPAMIHVRSADEAIALRPLLQPIGIDCSVSDDFDFWNEAADSLGSAMSSPTLPPLHPVADITLDDMHEFYVAADKWYRARPWLKVAGDTPLRVSGEMVAHELIATIMGQSGTLIGVSLFDKLDLLRSLFSNAGKWGKKQSGRAWSVMFNEQHEIDLQDTDLVHSHGWPIAAPEAWPSVCQVVSGKPVVCENATLIRQATLALTALTDISTSAIQNPTPREIHLPSGQKTKIQITDCRDEMN